GFPSTPGGTGIRPTVFATLLAIRCSPDICIGGPEMPDLVLYEASEKIGFVTLNRPDKLNALSMEVRRALAAAFAQAAKAETPSAVVLRGAGRSFCVGYDLGGGGNEAWRRDALKFHQRLSVSLALELTPWYMKKPVVASVQGHALGAGCELAMFCDLTIAADD